MTAPPSHTLLARWQPVTRDLGLIDAKVDDVVGALEQWDRSIGWPHRRREVGASLAAAFDALPPLSAEKRRKLLVATAKGWTAYFQSGIDGSDPFPAMSYLAQRMGVLAMRVCCTPLAAKFPAVIWEVYAPEPLGGCAPLGYRRSIASANDGGRWRFEQSGEPFPFERTNRYDAPRKRDRFSPDLLAEYLQHFGLRPFEDDFYIVTPSRPAALLEQQRPWVHPAPEFTLAEVIAGRPWDRKGN